MRGSTMPTSYQTLKDITLYFFGIVSGLALSLIADRLKELTDPDIDALWREHDAIRVCIERSDCRLSMDDWIRYYDLKWSLTEEKDIE